MNCISPYNPINQTNTSGGWRSSFVRCAKSPISWGVAGRTSQYFRIPVELPEMSSAELGTLPKINFLLLFPRNSSAQILNILSKYPFDEVR